MPGIATLSCYHPTLSNAKEDRPNVTSFGVHRSKHPGAGAFTYLANVTVKATMNIKQGNEVFLSYWNESQLRDLGEDIPLSGDYTKADIVINETEQFVSEVGVGNISEHWHQIVSKLPPRVIAALPPKIDTFSELTLLKQMGSARSSLRPMSRSMEWLQTNGICLDSVYGKKSQIDGAGQGAFALSHYDKDDVVLTAPTLHIAEKDYLLFRKGSTKTQQLLLNYCFGHNKSSVLLCPYAGLEYLINHSKSPNVAIRWSSHRYHQSQWLNESLELLSKRNKTGLFFDFIALREIGPHEEILLDYGDDWAKGWEAYVASWKAPTNVDSYEYSFLLNKKGERIKTIEERELDPFPENVMTICWYCFDEKDMKKHHNTTLSWSGSEEKCFSPCSVLKRDVRGKGDVYTARINPRRLNNAFLLGNIPRDAIQYVERPGFSDQQLPGAFRHWIGLPDDMLPSLWHVAANS